MTGGDLSLGRIRGIQIRINWTWVPIFALVAWSLAVTYFPAHFPRWTESEYWAVGTGAALLLFACVLVHELSHSFVAQARGLPVDTITLYIFGGVSNLTREPTSAGEEFWIAFAGPLSSIVLGLMFLALHELSSLPDWLVAIFGYLGAINLILALFNLIPAFPLDGGRVFRAIVWGIAGDVRRGTRIAVQVSRLFAWFFIFVGVWQMVVGDFVGGLWLAFIGWFLNNAATSSYQQAQQSAEFQDVDVRDVMARNVVTIDSETALETVVTRHLFQPGTRAVPVVDEGVLRGILTVTDARHFPPGQWPVIKAWRAMTPRERLDVVTPDAPVLKAIDLMNAHGHNQLPVVDNGDHLVGMLARSDILLFLQIRHELRARPRSGTGKPISSGGPSAPHPPSAASGDGLRS